MPIQNHVQELRNFKQSPICVRAGISAELGEVPWLEQLLHSIDNLPKAFQYNSHLLLRHPQRVVALLRQRAAVALHDHRQVQLQSLTDAPGARFSDKEI